MQDYYNDNTVIKERTRYTRYFFPTVEIKDCNVMINGQIFFWTVSKKLSKNISWHLKNCNGQGHVYTNGCLLDYTYFKEYDKKIAIDLSNLSALDADPKAIQQINFTGNIDWDRVATMFFIIAEAK